MADTVRTLTDLLTNLFQDGQATGSIVAQRMRDLLVSVAPSHGSFYVSSAAATVVAVAGTYTKVLGTTTLNPNSDLVDMPANNRLRYTGAAAKHFGIDCSFSVTSPSSNQVMGVRIWHYDDSAGSGAYLDFSEIRRKIGTGTDIGAASCHADVEMETNDYVELHLTNYTGTNNIQLDYMYMRMFGFLD